MIEIPMYLYNWGMSERQIDLLLIDQPLVVYKKDKSKKKGKSSSENTNKPSALAVLDAQEKWLQKYGVASDQKAHKVFNPSAYKPS